MNTKEAIELSKSDNQKNKNSSFRYALRDRSRDPASTVFIVILGRGRL